MAQWVKVICPMLSSNFLQIEIFHTRGKFLKNQTTQSRCRKSLKLTRHTSPAHSPDFITNDNW